MTTAFGMPLTVLEKDVKRYERCAWLSNKIKSDGNHVLINAYICWLMGVRYRNYSGSVDACLKLLSDKYPQCRFEVKTDLSRSSYVVVRSMFGESFIEKEGHDRTVTALLLVIVKCFSNHP